MSRPSDIGWVEPAKPIRGLDHLGVQSPCIALYSQLLPGITNVTDRARYYSFNPWLIRSFEQRYRDHSIDEFRRVLRRAECLFALIAIRHARVLNDRDAGRHGLGMVGRQSLLRIAEDAPAIRLNDHADLEGSSRYFKNPAGGLGQYYFGALRDLRVLDYASDGDRAIPGYDKARGTALKDGDPLAELISGHDKSLLLERLFDGTTDQSRMGRVRRLWRDHLQLQDDEALRAILAGLRVLEGHRSLDELRSNINLRARVVGMLAHSDANSDFRYDELARQLKVRGLNGLTRTALEQLCREEGLFAARQDQDSAGLSVAVRSFLGPASDIVGASPDNTLLLVDRFRQRYLRDDLDWQADIRPSVEGFLREKVRTSCGRLRLILDAHASIAFLAGATLDLKSGVFVELVQKGRVGARTWRADDGTAASGARLDVAVHDLNEGQRDIALAIGISQSTEAQTRSYIASKLPNVGRLVSVTLPTGPGQQNVTGGGHAAALAEQIANVVRGLKTTDPDAVVHIFAACPNSVLFFLGQQHQGIAPCVVYEFDFDRRGSKTYQPSFVID